MIPTSKREIRKTAILRLHHKKFTTIYKKKQKKKLNLKSDSCCKVLKKYIALRKKLPSKVPVLISEQL